MPFPAWAFLKFNRSQQQPHPPALFQNFFTSSCSLQWLWGICNVSKRNRLPSPFRVQKGEIQLKPLPPLPFQ